jgi:hypothetical protein
VTEVYLEIGKKKVFACVLDWPGWCRSGKSEHDALAALDEYADRYAVIAKRAKMVFRPGELTVVETVAGGSTTDFGAPDKMVTVDAQPLSAKDAQRQVKLLRAAWAELDAVAAVTPEHLLKGPRGGGRDRDKMLDHVIGSEASYARTVGVKVKVESYEDSDAVAELRDKLAAVLAEASPGGPVGGHGWPSRYAARRIAWHVLDHVWEMQDKTPPQA